MICKAIGCTKQTTDDYCLEHARLMRDYANPPPKKIKLTTKTERGCTVDGCDRPHCAKNLCRTHYTNMMRQRSNETRMITYLGETKTVNQWAKKLGITSRGLQYRLSHWPIDVALTRKKNTGLAVKSNVRLTQDHVTKDRLEIIR